MGKWKNSTYGSRAVKLDGWVKQIDSKWLSLVTADIMAEILDFCFLDGPKSLLNIQTWEGIVALLKDKEIQMTVEDCKKGWILHVDEQLNGMCKTNVDRKEEFPGWIKHWDHKQDKDKMFEILSKRLKSVFDERVALRGWILGVDYKTLKEELKMTPSEPGHVSQSSTVEPLKSTQGMPEEKNNLDRSKVFEKYSFLVLEKPHCEVDSVAGRVVRTLVEMFGGSIVAVAEEGTVIIASSYEDYTSDVLKTLKPSNSLVSKGYFLDVIDKVCNQKPWALQNRMFSDGNDGGNSVANLGYEVEKGDVAETTSSEMKCNDTLTLPKHAEDSKEIQAKVDNAIIESHDLEAVQTGRNPNSGVPNDDAANLSSGGTAETENITDDGDVDDVAKHAERLHPDFVSQPLDYDSDTRTEVITSSSESPSSELVNSAVAVHRPKVPTSRKRKRRDCSESFDISKDEVQLSFAVLFVKAGYNVSFSQLVTDGQREFNKHCKNFSIPEDKTDDGLKKYVKTISESLNFDAGKIFDGISEKFKLALGLEDKHVEGMKKFQQAEQEERAKKAEKKRHNIK